MAENRLQLFVAQKDVPYVPRKYEIPYMQLFESFVLSSSITNEGSPAADSDDRLLALCRDMVNTIVPGKSKKLLQFFHYAENGNDDSADEDDDDDDNSGAGSTEAPIWLDYTYDDLQAAAAKSWSDIDGVSNDELSDLQSVVQLIGDKNNIQLLICIDDRIDKEQIIRRRIRKAVSNRVDFDTRICTQDLYTLDMKQRAEISLQKGSPNSIKQCYYPLQEFAAEQLVKRIRYILKQNHPEKLDLDSFDSFDFRIYTAKSKMLERQTIVRLCDQRAGCFRSSLYKNARDLSREAEKRVRMYVVTKRTEGENEALKREAEENPRRLFLIIADEAHWGTSKMGNTGVNANDKFVNTWGNDHCNVIVLLVTATPWNLLTNRSRIPVIYVTNDETNADKFTIVEIVGRRTRRTKDGRDVTAEAGSLKELHVMKWHENIEHSLERGLIVTLRVPLKARKTPLWLTIESDKSETGLYRWVGSDNPIHATELLLQTNDRGYLTITTVDRCRILAVREVSGRDAVVGFAENSDSSRSKNISTDFLLLSDFFENLVEFRPIKRSMHLKFEHTSIDNQEEYYGSVKMATSPRNIDINCLQMFYHSLGYTFLIEKQRQLDVEVQEQYLSLNFYFNSIRNEKPEKQLIRGDKFFQDMASCVVGEHNCAVDDVLAAEYAYYILIANLVRAVSADHKKFIEEPEEYVKNICNHIRRMTEELKEDANEEPLKPISHTIFDSVAEYLARKTSDDCLHYVNSNGFTNDGEIEELAGKLIYSYLHADSVTRIDKIRERLGDDLYQRVLDHVSGTSASSELQYSAERTLSLRSETFRIVNDLIMKLSPADNAGITGHMKVIRMSDKACGNRLYTTLTIARKIGSQGSSFCFEILRYFDKLTMGNYNKIEPVKRIWQVLQRDKCEYSDSKMSEKCDCKKYVPANDRVECSECNHEHRQIRQFCDLDGLPCIVILVERGRMGDTFPPSFNVMDLRVRSQNKVPPMSSLVQELGRMCRYQERTDVDCYRDLPYALVGSKIISCFKDALNEGAPMYCAFRQNDIDMHCKKRKKGRKKKTQQVSNASDTETSDDESSGNSLLPGSGHYDRDNNTVHDFRLLFQAEPQIGKTGVYLKTIALLRKAIEGDGEQHHQDDDNSNDDDGENEYCDSGSDVDSDEDSHEHKQVGETKPEGSHPYWKNMVLRKLKKKINEHSKYYNLFGPYEYGEKPTFIPTAESSDRTCSKKRRVLKEPLSNTTNGKKFRTYGKRNHSCYECKPTVSVKIHRFYFVPGTNFVNVSIPQLDRFSTLLHVLKKHRAQQDDLPNGFANDSQNLARDTEAGAPTLQQCNDGEDDGRPVLKTWIFNPSYRRPEEASINYTHSMVDDNGTKCSYVQIVVVRSGEFDEYAAHWQTTHAILELPDTLTLPDCGGQVDVETGGVGYARRFIQLFAETLNIDHIFLLDDNILRVYEASTSPHRSPSAGKHTMNVENVPLFRVLKQIELQFDCTVNNVCSEDFENFPLEDDDCDCSTRGESQTSTVDSRIHHYTGPRDNYGVIGVRKSRQNMRRFTRKFINAHVYSLVFMNVRALKRMKIRYRPWQVREDCNLNNDCDQKGLWVCKYSRFIVTKTVLTPWLPRVFYWNEETRMNAAAESLADPRAVDDVFRWIRLRLPPKRIEEVTIENAAFLLSPKSAINSPHLLKLFKVRDGRTHVVIFRSQESTSVTDNDQYEQRTSSDTIIEDQQMKAIGKYFTLTPGIGGFNEHVIILHTPLCLINNLLTVADFHSRLVTPMFNQPVSVSVFTSQNVEKFRAPFVMIHVTGTILNPNDRFEEGNTDGETSKVDAVGPLIDDETARSTPSSDGDRDGPSGQFTLSRNGSSSSGISSEQEFQATTTMETRSVNGSDVTSTARGKKRPSSDVENLSSSLPSKRPSAATPTTGSPVHDDSAIDEDSVTDSHRASEPVSGDDDDGRYADVHESEAQRFEFEQGPFEVEGTFNLRDLEVYNETNGSYEPLRPNTRIGLDQVIRLRLDRGSGTLGDNIMKTLQLNEIVKWDAR